MSRPETTGVPYFPLVTEWDQKLKLIKAKFGLSGLGCIVEIWKAVYREGYALTWDEDAELLFAAENGMDLAALQWIVTFAAERGIFDRDTLERNKILTSHGIQKQWLSIVRSAHRKNTEIDPEICLLDENEKNEGKVEKKPRDRSINSSGNHATGAKSREETPQSKEEKRREEKEDQEGQSTGFPDVSTKACRQASSAREESAPVAPLPACLPEFAQGIKNQVLKAPWRTSFTDADYLAFSGNLTAKLTDLGFVEYAIRKIASDRSVKNPAGLLKTQLLDGAAWIDEYTWEPEKGPKTWSSAAPDPEPDAPLMSSSQLAEIKARVTGKREKAGAA